MHSGSDDTDYRFIVGSSSKDCREVAAVLRNQLAAKGGGTAPMIQGSLQATQEKIRNVLTAGYSS